MSNSKKKILASNSRSAIMRNKQESLNQNNELADKLEIYHVELI